jgi:hypothetical protein
MIKELMIFIMYGMMFSMFGVCVIAFYRILKRELKNEKR